MHKTIVQRHQLPPISFVGELIGMADSSGDHFSLDRPEEIGRSIYFLLYRTRGRKYVCQRIIETLWSGENEQSDVVVCHTIEEIFDFFGPSRLLVQLFERAEIPFAIEVD